MNRNEKTKYISVLGDSLSTLAGYNPPDYAVFYEWENKRTAGIYSPDDTWWGKVINALGGKLLVNNSFSGSTVTKHPSCEIESYGCSDARTSHLGFPTISPDIILVLLGINDWGCGMQIYPTEDEKGLNVFSVAYSAMLEKIKSNYPDAEICCLTFPRSAYKDRPDIEIPFYKGGGSFADYCDAIKKCAKEASCRLLDIYEPNAPYDTIDGFHPTAEGMQTIADAVIAAYSGAGSDDN
ncbi:MAG: hypothetical protein IJF74_01130 [Clostridia bacterium]|nr:hypothetical protein [Clostridia bacterium]